MGARLSHRGDRVSQRAREARAVPLGGLLSLLSPQLCWGCGAELRGGPLCGGCRAGLQWLGPEPAELCGVDVWSALAYENAARELVKGLKFRGARALAQTMAAQIVANAPVALLRPAARVSPPALVVRPALVPVPLSPERARRRGFNQAAVLAQALGQRSSGCQLEDCLERRGRSAPQVGRPRAERLGAVAGSVEHRPGASIPSRALIIDDVVTTGATLAACAAALRRAGTPNVAAITYARTIGR